MPPRPLRPWRTSLTCLLVGGLAACGGGPSTSDGPSVAVRVAALDLPGVANACYSLVIQNGDGDVVVREDDVCADRFGDGRGGLSAVLPCDAGEGVTANRVTLVLAALYDADGTAPADRIAEASYVNPCGLPADHPLAGGAPVNDDGFGPCAREVTCSPDADRAVAFDLTVLRRGGQGFFDTAVSLGDVFCSAKLDCIPDPPGFVLDPVTDERGASVIVGFACTSGTGADGVTPEPTWLYLSDLVLTCDGAPALAPIRLDLAAVSADGNQGARPPGVFQWLQFTQDEARSPTVDECAWSFAIGLDTAALAGRNCTLEAWGSASSDATPWSGLTPPADAVWPVVRWSGQVLAADGRMCDDQPLDVPGSAVRTTYTIGAQSPRVSGAVPPPPFVVTRRCGGESEAVTRCVGLGGATVAASTVEHGGEAVPAVTITVDGVAVSYRLPTDGEVDLAPSACCVDSCCATP